MGSDESGSGDTMEKLRKDLLRGRTTVVFGRYPQGANGEIEPLTWRVLDVKGSRILIITEKLIDAVPYNKFFEIITWKTCTLRRWMNGEFIREAFNEEEASHIVVTNVKNGKYEEYGTNGREDTLDRVFALNFDEVRRYFSGYDDRIAEVTPYAIGRKSWYSTHIRRRFFGEKDQKKVLGSWWLRSPDIHDNDNRTMLISFDGYIYEHEYFFTHISFVRPALWLHL